MYKKAKYLILLIAVVMCLTPVQINAQGSVISSGLTTTDRLIATGNCYYYGIRIVSGASTAVISVYDALTASGTTIDKGNCPTSYGQCWGDLPFGVEVFNGIYVDTTGTGAAYTVFYKCK